MLRSPLLSLAHLPLRGLPGQYSKLLIDYSASRGQVGMTHLGVGGRDEEDPRTSIKCVCARVCVHACVHVCMYVPVYACLSTHTEN